jgi:8-oxo-dGTP pyrophosphatase MutT (NUDIX family)
MQWTVHGERVIYDSPWCRLGLMDVEVPGGPRFDHHVLRSSRPAVASIVLGEQGVLLLYRHRVVTGRWGWELPCGGVEPGESLQEAAAREVLEETGWKPGPMRPLFGYDPMNGLSDQRFECFVADGATRKGEPEDAAESSQVEWVDLDRTRQLMRDGLIPDGTTLTSLLWWLTFGEVPPPSRALASLDG